MFACSNYLQYNGYSCIIYASTCTVEAVATCSLVLDASWWRYNIYAANIPPPLSPPPSPPPLPPYPPPPPSPPPMGTLIRAGGYCYDSNCTFTLSSSIGVTFPTAASCGTLAVSAGGSVFSWRASNIYECYCYSASCSVATVATCSFTSDSRFNMYAT